MDRTPTTAWARLLTRIRWGLVVLPLCVPLCCHERPEPADLRIITVWAHQGRERENSAMLRIIEAFNNAHRDEHIRAQIHFFPDRQYADKVAIASASGEIPDVLDIDGPYVGPWAAEGLLRPIDEFLTAAKRRDFLPSIIQQGTFQNRLYALSAFDSALVVYYNRDIIERAGLDPPEHAANAWDWDCFVDALQRVKPYAVVPLSLHMDDPGAEWITYAFAPLIWSNGGQLIDADTHTVTGHLDGPQAIDALTRWQALFADGLAEPTTTRPNPFAAGLAAFDWSGHWMLPAYEAQQGLRFGVMPLPHVGDAPAYACGSWCWGMSRGCPDPDAAWKLIAWLTHPTHGVKPIVESNGAVPARYGAFEFFPAYERMPRRLFREQLETAAHPRPRTAVYLLLTTEFARAARDIALGAEVPAALSKAAATVQRAMDRRQRISRHRRP